MFDWIKNKSYKNRKDFGKFNFYIKHQPQYIDSSTTLTLTTYTNSSENATIPCRYRWSIIKNGLMIEVPQFKGSSFKCQPSDVGSIIQAQVISTDPEYSGTALIQFGPVKLDVTLKKQIQLGLSTGSISMPVCLVGNGEQKQCQIRLYEDIIKINHAYSDNNYNFDYSIFEPRIQCISKDSSRIVIIFSEKYQSQLKRFTKKLFQDQHSSKDLSNSSRSNQSTNSSHTPKLDIKFTNRNSRDIFLFTMKAFNTKKQLKSSVIINKIQKIDFTNQQTFDYILQIQGLKNQLVKMDQVVKKAHQQKIKYYEQIKKLQKQIQEIIITYTRIVQEKFQNQVQLSRDYSMLSTKRDQILAKKYKNLQNQNNHLNSRIHTLTKEIDNIRFKPPALQAPLVNSMNNINNNNSPPQKIFFNPNYEINQNYNNAFTKKKSYQNNNNNESLGIANILDQLGQSRISYANSMKQQNELKLKLQQSQKQKDQLQKKLQMSFHKIDTLQKQLFHQKQNKSNQLITDGQLNNNNIVTQRMNNSAIHFTYNTQPFDINFSYQKTNQNISLMVDREKQNLLLENNQLKKNNQMLELEKKKLIQQLKKPLLLSYQQRQEHHNNNVLNNSYHSHHKNQQKQNNDLNLLKTHKKQSISSLNTQKQKQYTQIINRKDNHIKLLKMQNQQLKKNNQMLKSKLQSLTIKNQHSQIQNNQSQKLLRKITQLQQQVQMYRKNSDALNRSQQISMQMDNYNEEQIQMLKQHNQFLTNENQKLAKACQKYMSQAKQSNKLRIQIIKLKQKINSLQFLSLNSSTNNAVIV